MKISLLPEMTLGLVLSMAAAHPLWAHDLQDNRATLVLREGGHLSVTLYIAYADALRAALAPQRPREEFLMVCSTMKPELLQKQLLRAQVRFQAATRIYLASGKQLTLTNWVWPDMKQVQAMLQHRIMREMVDPAGHAHDEPLEIHADANSSEPITAVRVQFPEEFQKVLLVWYRPNQLWVDPKSWSPAIRF